MTCETYRDGLFERLRGREAPAGHDAHAASCPACGALSGSILSNERILRAAAGPLKAPPEVWSAIAARIGQGRAVPFRRLRWAAAAAAALLLGAFVFLAPDRSARPRLDLVVVDVRPEARRAFEPFLPSYAGGGALARLEAVDR
jgi:predicted anti-sigma-YlaC factor YlaD